VSCPNCTPTRNCQKHHEELMREVERTIWSLDDQLGDPTLDDEERAEAREASDFLVAFYEKHYR
jgi:hypothetical protein